MNRCIIGDCRDTMRDLIAQGVKVQMCVTSPPYWGLRDYGHPGQLGMEATPAEFVANMVEVFRLVRDVLADDGVLWLNLGDSYASGGRGGGMAGEKGEKQRSNEGALLGAKKPPPGLKNKDLVGIPWRVAFALQADGWYLRQDIIWHKPNPMPESVTDRCTKAHEYLFLLSKNERYFYDAEAIKEPVAEVSITRAKSGWDPKKLNVGLDGPKNEKFEVMGERWVKEKANKRSVWTVATTSYSGAHFATFPPALIEPCILAGSRPGDIVLDPFFGSGTTGQVAEKLGRKWIGIELNPDYEPLSRARTQQMGMTL